MCDIFTKEDVRTIFKGKSFLFMGDSIMRNIYKDLVWLTSDKTDGEYIPQQHMRDKGETSFLGDNLTAASELTAARSYIENRDWFDKKCDIQYTFAFITRIFSDRVKDFINDYKRNFGSYPDLIIMNSALWDINRWGPDGISKFKENIHKLMKLLRKVLPAYTQVVWMTTPPISAEVRGGFMIKNLEFQRASMRFNIAEGNKYAAAVSASYGYDVLDMHYYMLNQIHRRAADGIHWNFDAVRLQTNLILTHYCLAHDLPLPGRIKPSTNSLLKAAMEIAAKGDSDFEDPIPRRSRSRKRSRSRSPESPRSSRRTSSEGNNSFPNPKRIRHDSNRSKGVRDRSSTLSESEVSSSVPDIGLESAGGDVPSSYLPMVDPFKPSPETSAQSLVSPASSCERNKEC